MVIAPNRKINNPEISPKYAINFSETSWGFPSLKTAKTTQHKAPVKIAVIVLLIRIGASRITAR